MKRYNTYDKRIGKMIAQLRHERGMTQKQLGELLDVSGSAVSDLENGYTTWNVKQLAFVSIGLGCSVQDVFSGIGSWFDQIVDNFEKEQ